MIATTPVVVKKTRSSISLPIKVESTVKEWLKKYSKITEAAKKRGLNESDTSNIVNDMLGEVFGFDKFFDVTTEYKIRGQYADYGVKIEDKLIFLIEIKAICVPLNENHIFQAASYASTEGVEWVVLTNLEEWRIYHLSFGSRIDQELVVQFNLIEEGKSVKIFDKASCLHKEGIKKGLLKKLWTNKVALSEWNLKKVLFGKSIVNSIRRELSKITGVKIGENDVTDLLTKLFETKNSCSK